MENEQQTVAAEEQVRGSKGNSSLIIVCVVLALVAVGLGAYLIIDKTGAGEKTKCAVSNSEKSSSGSDSSESVGFVYDTDPIGKYVDYGKYIITKDGDLYFAPESKITWYEDHSEKVSYSVDSEVGAKGKFEFEPDDISYYTPPMKEGQKINFEGYKLNVSNVQFVTELGFGQQKNGILVAIITKDGKMSILKTKEGFGENSKLVIKKDVEENVANVGTAYHGTGMYAVVYYRDGSSKKLNDEVFTDF